jgi:hypothetical protein
MSSVKWIFEQNNRRGRNRFFSIIKSVKGQIDFSAKKNLSRVESIFEQNKICQGWNRFFNKIVTGGKINFPAKMKLPRGGRVLGFRKKKPPGVRLTPVKKNLTSFIFGVSRPRRRRHVMASRRHVVAPFATPRPIMPTSRNKGEPSCPRLSSSP